MKQRRHLWGAEMSMVFQNPLNSLNPLMKIGKQIAEPLRLHLGMDKQNARETAVELLRSVRIPEPERRLAQYPHELSGGMRQRVMIAMALACGPTVLFADEPTTALDVTVQAQILEVIGEQRRDRNMSVVLVTHDLGVVAGHTDQIAVMYGGKLVERAPDQDPVRRHADAVHQVVAQEHPEAVRPEPHSARDDHRAAAGPGPPAEGLQLRAALPVRPAEVPRGGTDVGSHVRPESRVRLLVSGRGAPSSPSATPSWPLPGTCPRRSRRCRSGRHRARAPA